MWLWNAARTFIGLAGHFESRAEWNPAVFCLPETIPCVPSRSCLQALVSEGAPVLRQRLLLVLELPKSLQQGTFSCLRFNSRGSCCWEHDKEQSSVEVLHWGGLSIYILFAVFGSSWCNGGTHCSAPSPWVSVVRCQWILPDLSGEGRAPGPVASIEHSVGESWAGATAPLLLMGVQDPAFLPTSG